MQFVQILKKALERGRINHQLHKLSDRELRDIGISRSDIAYVVRHGRRPQDLLTAA